MTGRVKRDTPPAQGRPSPLSLDHAPPVGRPERLAPGIRAVTAPNAGPRTFTGTRSYIVGDGVVAVIDPGPDDPRHLDALAAAVAGERVAAVLVTHAHRDHSAGARRFAERVGAPVLAHGDPVGARRPAMARLAAGGGLGGGEGIDPAFRPDRRIGGGEVAVGPGWALTALATPGHTTDHLSFAWPAAGALFSGDLVMGWATPVISPPDGDLAAFRDSLARHAAREEGTYYPGHGAPVRDPRGLIAWVLAHREGREAEIRAALAGGPLTPAALAAAIYTGTDPRLLPAAERNVLAHLLDLAERGLAAPESPRPAEAAWSLVTPADGRGGGAS